MPAPARPLAAARRGGVSIATRAKPLATVSATRAATACALAFALLSAGLLAALPAAAQAPRPVTPRGPLGADELAHIELFKRLSPSVVHITTLGLQRDLFNRHVQQVPRGTGSGFVWDTAGHIVTNFHVIQGGNAATVTFSDQSTHDATLVGAFPDRDLAVLKVEPSRARLAPIPLGSSRELQVGQRVYAIGNPFGLDQTLTMGIVSALNREIESFNSRTIRGVVQTDAAINPGNSGGPLLDSAGRLVGVNTQIASPSGASAGIGFAIPADEVNRIVPRLIKDGRIVRPSLGISAASEGLRRALRAPEGVALVQVAPGGPADRAGLQAFARARDGSITPGDVITAINGEAVNSLDDVLTLLERHQPGDSVALSVWRAGRTRKLSVPLSQGE